MNPVSIRSRVMLWSATVVAVALMTFGIGTAWNLHRELIEEIDIEIHNEAKDFLEGVVKRQVNWGNPWDVDSLFRQSTRHQYVEVWKNPGTLLYRSRSLNGGRLYNDQPINHFYQIQWSGRTIRYGAFEKNGMTVVIGKDLREPASIVRSLFVAYAIALPLVILLVGVGVWWIARKALVPLELIAERAETISATDLDQRLPEDLPERDEVGRLVRVLNQMFGRLHMSFNQIARFTSDASHELKTPLSLIRAEVEHALNSGAVSPDQEKTLISLLEQSARLSQIIDALLFLSRADNHRLELERCEVNLTEIVGDLIEDVEILASPFGITIRKELASDLLVLGDPSLLRRLLMNLFDNAIKYNRTGGMVIATSEQRGEEVALSIRNTGQGVKHGTENQIFERFFRGDPAHTKAIGGHGLGLSIAREIARAHGGELRLIASDTQWTEFRFSLPAKSRSLRTLNPASGVPEIAKL